MFLEYFVSFEMKYYLMFQIRIRIWNSIRISYSKSQSLDYISASFRIPSMIYYLNNTTEIVKTMK